MQYQQKQWRKLTGEYVKTIIEDEVKEVILREKDRGHQLRVCIGTDSQVKGAETEFATAIVFIRKGNGGFMYVNSETSSERMSLKQRMMTEVSKSIEIAYLLSNLLINHDIDMEVHIDINTSPMFKSNDSLKEAVGYITGMGFSFKAKPDAFASSSCANKIVH